MADELDRKGRPTGRKAGTSLNEIAPGPMFRDWFGFSTPSGGTELVRGSNEKINTKAHNYLTQGGGGGMKEWIRPFDRDRDYLQYADEPQLQEFDLMQAIRDRMLRGQ